ncbi:MAG: DUF2723 domain-containing protein [Verrucomicrobiae bacterium]|nr:DUF2723 domain-containing protein [Verrucomicrobiae bacterium]
MASPQPYFGRKDWLSFWITTLVTFAVYLFTLAPSVSLEDSGEFLTASYHLGVPHPPGYPIWTISSYLFAHLIPYGEIAWRVNLMSAFYGALAAGILSLLTSKLAVRLWNLEQFKDFDLGIVSRESLVQAVSVVAGLVFAFTDTMWAQAVITEVYSMNSFFFTLLCLLTLRWFDSPGQWRWPSLISLFVGIGITNHQTILVAAPAFMLALFFIDEELFCDTCPLAAIVCATLAIRGGFWFMWPLAAGLLAAYLLLLFKNLAHLGLRHVLCLFFSLLIGVLLQIGLDFMFNSERNMVLWKYLTCVLCFITLLLVVWLIVCHMSGEGNALRAAAPFLLSTLMFLAGSSLYLYMPLSSATNPPMNWGYTKTIDGFRHHILREQYERIETKRPLPDLVEQYVMFFDDLRENFTAPLVVTAVLPLFFIPFLRRRDAEYMAFTISCFFLMGFALVYLLNPKFDDQSRFICRVFYGLAHGVFSLWVGLGLVFAVYFAKRMRNLVPQALFALVMMILAFWGLHTGRSGMVITASFGGAALYFMGIQLLLRLSPSPMPILTVIYMLPLLSITANWNDAEMRGHDFGWRYGHDMLKGLDKDAVVYGGTDPGRFVPTYMIFVDSFQDKKWKRDPDFDRRDLYIITQNALADQTYMKYIRDHYATTRPKMDRWYHKLLGRDKTYPKAPLILPSEEEFTVIFNQAIENAKKESIPGIVFQKDASGQVRATVQGLEGVFAINGEVARWIFERNKDKHSFYVEESYPLNWMYPYLEPCGLIMKLNKEPLKELSQEVIQRDMSCWKRLTADLLSNRAFLNDIVARRAFSKLRSSIAGLYAARALTKEAEHALLESIDLCPTSSEARARLIQLFAGQERFTDAMVICQEWERLDPNNRATWQTEAQIRSLEALAAKEKEMAAAYPQKKQNPEFIFQFAELLRTRAKMSDANKVIDEYLDRKETSLNWWQKALDFYAAQNQVERVETLLKRLISRQPQYAPAHYNLSILLASLGRHDEAVSCLAQSFKLDHQLRTNAIQDPRLAPLQGYLPFTRLLQSPPEGKNAAKAKNKK